MARSRDEDDLPLSRVRPLEEDVRSELEFHIEQRAAELVAQGQTPEHARQLAREFFGDRAEVEAECRTIEQRRRQSYRRARRWEAVRQDLAVGLRLLRRTPAFSLAAIATLALGIGATTAVFTVAYDVLLKPLPYADGDRLVTLSERHQNGFGSLPWPNFRDLEDQSKTIASMAAYGSSVATVLGSGEPARVKAAVVSRNFYSVFKLTPYLGRIPNRDDHALGANPVVVVSYAFWRDHLGAPRSLNGVRLTSDREYEVVGVLPSGFHFPNETQIWAPLELNAQGESRTGHNWDAVGRLATDATPDGAARELGSILARLRPLYLPDFDAVGAVVTPLQASLTRSARAPLYLLLGASALLLLTACSNLAGAMLARGTARGAELAVRSALGATRSRLVRQLVTESALLAIAGGVAGVFLAKALVQSFVALAPGNTRLDAVVIRTPIIVFAIGISALTALLFGLLPALRASARGPAAFLRDGGRGTGDVKGTRAWRTLVSAEVALAVVLLFASGILLKSLRNVLAVPLGFDPVNIVTAQVSLPEQYFSDTSNATSAFHETVLERLRSVAGISAAGLANVPPLADFNPSGSLQIEGRPVNENGGSGHAGYRVVSGDFFRAAGIRILRGRTFSTTDDRTGPRVAIISESFANRYFPGQDPLGKRIRPHGMDASGDKEAWAEIIGVVADTRTNQLTQEFRPVYYFDHRQRPAFRSRSVTYLVRSTLATQAVAQAVRDAAKEVNANVPTEIREMDSIVAATTSDRRFTAIILSAFAATALLLAGLGVFAVVSYSTAQRRREIGVRLALGETPLGVQRLVVAGALRAIAPGLAIGALFAVGSARLLRSQVYGVSTFDPVALGTAVLALGLAGIISSYLPALRSSQTDPLRAIRSD